MMMKRIYSILFFVLLYVSISSYIVNAQETIENITVSGINVQTNYVTFVDGSNIFLPIIKITLPTTFNFSDVVFMYLNLSRNDFSSEALTDDDINIALWNNSNFITSDPSSIYQDMDDGFLSTSNRTSTALLSDGCKLNVGQEESITTSCLLNVTDLLQPYLDNNVALGQNMTFVLMDPDIFPFALNPINVIDTANLFLGNNIGSVTFDSNNGGSKPPNLLIGLSNVTVNVTSIGMQSIISPIANQWNSSSPVFLNISGDFLSNVTFNIDGGTNSSFCIDCFTNTALLNLQEGTHNISFFAVHNSTLNSTGLNAFSVGLTLGLCSDPFFTTPSANFTYRVEGNDTVVAGTSQASFLSLLNSSVGFSNDFSVASDTIQVCTVANAGSMNSQTFIVYAVSGFTERSLSALQVFNNVLKFFDLFVEVDGETVAIIVTVQDVNNKLLGSRTVDAERFFVSTNSFKLVDSCLTDENGVCELDLNDASNIVYRFRVKNGLVVELQTGKQVLTSTSLTLIVLGGLERTLEILNNLVGKIISVLFFDDTTNVVTLTYTENDDVISLACLDVFNKTAQSSIQIANVCSTEESDTLTFTIPSVNISYVAYFNVIAIEDGNNYTVGEPLDINLNKDFEQWGTTGLVIAFIVILAFAGTVAQSPILIVFAVLISLLVLTFTNIVFIQTSILIGLIAIGIIGVVMMSKRRGIK